MAPNLFRHYWFRRFTKFGLVLAIALGVASAIVVWEPSFRPVPASAQIRVRPDGVWQQIYQQLPDLSKENQYVNRETGNVDPENTLVGRVIRYHLYVKGRSPFYRLDWKLTMADYLGANEPIEDSAYPGESTLRKNPVEGDTAVIRQLNRRQRDALVNALVGAFSPQVPQPRRNPSNPNVAPGTSPSTRSLPTVR